MRAPLIAVLPLLALAACGKPAETTVKTANTQVQTSPAGTQVTVTDQTGQTTIVQAGAVPVPPPASPAAPDFAPSYPGATVLSRIDTPTGGAAVTILKFTTPDTADKVLDFYRAAARKAGVPVSADAEMDGGKMFAAEEESGARGVQLTASTKDGLTIVQLTYHAPKG